MRRRRPPRAEFYRARNVLVMAAKNAPAPLSTAGRDDHDPKEAVMHETIPRSTTDRRQLVAAMDPASLAALADHGTGDDKRMAAVEIAHREASGDWLPPLGARVMHAAPLPGGRWVGTVTALDEGGEFPVVVRYDNMVVERCAPGELVVLSAPDAGFDRATGETRR